MEGARYTRKLEQTEHSSTTVGNFPDDHGSTNYINIGRSSFRVFTIVSSNLVKLFSLFKIWRLIKVVIIARITAKLCVHSMQWRHINFISKLLWTTSANIEQKATSVTFLSACQQHLNVINHLHRFFPGLTCVGPNSALGVLCFYLSSN